ncbi:MFS transporter [Streptomyces sp. NPDC002533]
MLINRNFGLLWAGQAVSEIGDYAFGTTLAVWIGTVLLHDRPHAPAAVAGIAVVIGATTLLLGPIAGVFVDRWDRRRTMMGADLLRAALMALAAVFVALPAHVLGERATIILLYALVCAATAASQYFNPARFALVADVVEPKDRGRAAAASQTTHAFAVIAGPPLATPLLFAVGMRWMLLLNACSFLLSFLLVRHVRGVTHEPSEYSPGTSPGARIRAELAEGLRMVAGNRDLRVLSVAVGLGTVGFAAFTALGVFFVTENLHTSPQWYGAMEGALGLGLVAGILCMSRLERFGHHRLFTWGMLATGTALAVGSRCTSLTPALLVMLLLGIPLAITHTAFTPIVLNTTPRTHLGRVLAVINPIEQAAALAGASAAGWLASSAAMSNGLDLGPLRLGRIDGVLTLAAAVVLAAGLYATVTMKRPAASRPVPAHQAPTLRAGQ